MNVLAASYKYFNNSSNIMYISLIRILIISVRAIYFGVFVLFISVCIKYIVTMYGVYVSNRCILL